jgi:hygromycin-B 4-O-kinase
MSAKMQLTKEQVTQFLASHYKGDVSDVSPLSGGEWSQAFAFRRENVDYVVRFGLHKDDYLKDQFASGFRSPRLPIPRVLEVGDAFDAYFAISERAFGMMIDDQDTANMVATIPSFLATMDAMRETDITITHGFGSWDIRGNGEFSSWREFLLAVDSDVYLTKIPGWRTNLENSPFGSSIFNEAHAKLAELSQDLPEVRSLVHCDLLNFNVIVNDNKITAVIDWGNALYGDFLYDLANYVFWSEQHPPVMGIDWKAEALKHYKSIGLQVPEFEKRLLCCLLHVGLGSLAYYSYKQSWEQFEPTAKRISGLIKT